MRYIIISLICICIIGCTPTQPVMQNTDWQKKIDTTLERIEKRDVRLKDTLRIVYTNDTLKTNKAFIATIDTILQRVNGTKIVHDTMRIKYIAKTNTVEFDFKSAVDSIKKYTESNTKTITREVPLLVKEKPGIGDYMLTVVLSVIIGALCCYGYTLIKRKV